MTQDEKDFIAEQFKGVHQKIDLIINPVKEDVTGMKVKLEAHSDRLIELEEFKKGHQKHHEDQVSRTRFNWEILAGSGFIGGALMWIMKGGK